MSATARQRGVLVSSKLRRRLPDAAKGQLVALPIAPQRKSFAAVPEHKCASAGSTAADGAGAASRDLLDRLARAPSSRPRSSPVTLLASSGRSTTVSPHVSPQGVPAFWWLGVRDVLASCDDLSTIAPSSTYCTAFRFVPLETTAHKLSRDVPIGICRSHPLAIARSSL